MAFDFSVKVSCQASHGSSTETTAPASWTTMLRWIRNHCQQTGTAQAYPLVLDRGVKTSGV